MTFPGMFAPPNAQRTQAMAAQQRCAGCGRLFPSRNQLFRHLKAHGEGGCGGAPRPEPEPERPARFRYSELFAGVGGFAVGLDALGGRCVFACEIEGQARGCYEANFGCPLARDVRGVKGADVPEHELLTAGFPCQPFSREGTQPGLEHRLGLLFAEIVRLLVASRPAMFLLENVPGLLSAQGGAAMEAVLAALTGAGYDVRWRVVDAAALLPQTRRRVWLAGFRGAGRGAGFKFPALPLLHRGVGEILEAPGSAACDACALSSEQWAKRLRMAPAAMWLAQLKQPLPTLTRNYRKAPGAAAAAKCVAAAERFAAVAVAEAEARAEAAEIEADDHGGVAEPAATAERGAGADDGDDDDDQDDTDRPRAGRRNLIGVALPEHDGDAGGSQPPPRFLTPRECARVQGFPESFKLPQNGAPNGPSAALFGNAVSPPVVAAIVEAMLRHHEASIADTAAVEDDAGLCEASEAEVDGARREAAEAGVLRATVGLLERAVPAESRAALRATVEAVTT
jgi:site-specific DNA-cytosine methylase